LRAKYYFMKNGYWFCIFLILLIGPACEKEDDDVSLSEVGDLTVTVRQGFGQVVAGASVYTNPPTRNGLTDEFGSTLLRDLPAGSYEVFAELTGYGSGKATVNVQADGLTNTDIFLQEGVDIGLAPSIVLLFPVLPASFAPGEEITFRAEVSDDQTAVSQLSITWESDQDGVLHTANAGADGITTFVTSSLSEGTHQITLRVKDADDYEAVETFELRTDAPSAIGLEEASATPAGIQLRWTRYSQANFGSYRVYRSDRDCSDGSRQLLAEITAIDDVEHLDSRAPFANRVCYDVEVVTDDGRTRRSNTLSVDNPSGPVFNFVPHDFLLHPLKDEVFLLDKGGHRIVRYNYLKQEETGVINVEGESGFCAIGDNGFGVELYVPSSDGWVYVYGADDLALRTSINTGLRNSSVVVNGLGHVVVALQPSPWWEQPVRTYSRATGLNLDGNGDFDGDRLRMIPGNNKIISISQSVSPIDMEYFELNSEGMITLHQDDTYHGDHPLDPHIFRISPLGEYVITSRQGAVYSANSSMEYRGQLQRGALSFSDFAFSPDGKTIYAGTNDRASIQIGSYPELTRSNEILTRGFPLFMEYRDGKIICVSQSEEAGNVVGIEVVEVE
jgi:hypothetical protein